MGVVEESHSDWASPIILLPKTDGSVRSVSADIHESTTMHACETKVL